MGIDYKKKYLKYKNKYLEAKKLYGGDFEEFTHEDGTPILYKVVDKELRDDEGAFFYRLKTEKGNKIIFFMYKKKYGSWKNPEKNKESTIMWQKNANTYVAETGSKMVFIDDKIVVTFVRKIRYGWEESKEFELKYRKIEVDELNELIETDDKDQSIFLNAPRQEVKEMPWDENRFLIHETPTFYQITFDLKHIEQPADIEQPEQPEFFIYTTRTNEGNKAILFGYKKGEARSPDKIWEEPEEFLKINGMGGKPFWRLYGNTYVSDHLGSHALKMVFTSDTKGVLGEGSFTYNTLDIEKFIKKNIHLKEKLVKKYGNIKEKGQKFLENKQEAVKDTTGSYAAFSPAEDLPVNLNEMKPSQLIENIEKLDINDEDKNNLIKILNDCLN